jgi:AcrR family transcriptional regulator
VGNDEAVVAAKEGSSEAQDDADGGSTRGAILQATLRLLEHHGYTGITTEAIAAEARVSKATIYRHWRSKEKIVVDAARLRFDTIEPPDLGSFEQEVRWILSKRLADYRRPGTIRLVAGIIGAAATDHELRTVFDEWIEYLSRAIRRVAQRGIARNDVHPDIDIFSLETLVAGVVSRAVVTGRSYSDATIDHLANMIANAARAPSPCD